MSPFLSLYPKKTLKRAWIGISKRNAQNIKTCKLSKLLHRFKPNFVQWQKPSNIICNWSKHKYNNPRQRTSAIIKIEKVLYLLNGLTDRHKIWQGDAYCHPPPERYGQLAWPISAKCGIVIHIYQENCIGSSKFEFLKVQDSGRPPFW